ncbi:MAG: PH domain-containing protein [Bacteroidia bacterium]
MLHNFDLIQITMKEYKASRMSKGNKVLPNKIRIDNDGITFRIPGVFSGEEKTIPFSRISSVEVNTPLVGFSSITINTTGEGAIVATGFYKEDVLEIKKIVLEKINTFQNKV